MASRSCRYTVPPVTTGLAASAPAPCTPAAAVPVMWNDHASRSEATFAAEITDPAASRVLPPSPFGYAHVPDGVAAPANPLVDG